MNILTDGNLYCFHGYSNKYNADLPRVALVFQKGL